MSFVFMILLLILVILFYISNRGNKVNKWAAFSGFFFWIGVFKEEYLLKVIPYLENATAGAVSHELLIVLYSIQAWAANTLSMPTAIITSLYFCDMQTTNVRVVRLIGAALGVLVVVLTILFPPFSFIEYQTNSQFFWTAYSLYNFILCGLFSFFVVKGVRGEKSQHVRKQKRLVAVIILPPVIYCLLTIYIVHPLGLDMLYDLWQGNVFIIALCLLLFIYMAFHDGTMGLRLSRATYDWNSDMDLINKSIEYTSHMLKNQTVKMELCIDNLREQYDSSQQEPPEELAILSRSISILKGHVNRIKKHSESIVLVSERSNVWMLLDSAILSLHSAIPIHCYVKNDVTLICDKTHIVEVFVNILSNAIEASDSGGTIEVSDGRSKRGRSYSIHFTDHGVGIGKDDLKKLFMPHFTTKNTEQNFGLGLAYCKNVMEKHGGQIHAHSELGKGATITIVFPARRVSMGRPLGRRNAGNGPKNQSFAGGG